MSTFHRDDATFAAPIIADILDLNGAWTIYNPAISSGSGTLTSASATGRWKAIDKIIFLEIVATITTNGTGASFISIVLPATCKSQSSGIGREGAISGKAVVADLAPSGTVMNILFFDGTYPGSNGASINISAVYESI
jgi:hypothetical protein